MSKVQHTLYDLRCRVSCRTAEGVAQRDATVVVEYHRFGETEIGEEQLKVLVEQKILALQIPAAGCNQVCCLDWKTADALS